VGACGCAPKKKYMAAPKKDMAGGTGKYVATPKKKYTGGTGTAKHLVHRHHLVHRNHHATENGSAPRGTRREGRHQVKKGAGPRTVEMMTGRRAKITRGRRTEMRSMAT
jgi:hypothetical protein